MIRFCTIILFLSVQAYTAVAEDDYSSQQQDQTQRKKHGLSYSMGIGLNIPEINPIEFAIQPTSKMAIRAFISPAYRFNIDLHLPEDQISSKNSVIVSHNSLDIPFSAVYGPQYGLELVFFPVGGPFFLSFGTL